MEKSTSKVYVAPASALGESLLAATGTGSPLFVINLCASIAPIPVAGKTIPGLESYRLYQVARNEDGRTRHRLRLGFFASEDAAEQVLATVRNSYPTAFTTCLGNDDHKFARGFRLDATAAAPARQRPVAVEMAPVKAIPPVVIAQPKPVVASSAASVAVVSAVTFKPAIDPAIVASAPAEAQIDESAVIELTWEPPAPASATSAAISSDAPQRVAVALDESDFDLFWEAAAAKPAESQPVAAPAKRAAPIELTLAAEPVSVKQEPCPTSGPAESFHVGKGVEIPAMSLTLESQPAEASASIAHVSAAKNAVAKAPSDRAPIPPARAAIPNQSSFAANRLLPELDSTQTIRALTSAELDDDSQEKWFAIQLVVSEQPVNLDAMPHLDIFEAYRLYSVANAGSGKILHSLRIGFFREQVSAEAVCGYLKTFFPGPSVLRISTAEQLRFKDAVAPKAAATAKSDGRVIELNHARERAVRPTIPTVTMEVAAGNHGATGTFRTGATGSHKVNATGSHQALNPALKPATKSAALATQRSASSKTSTTGKHKTLPKKSLSQQLRDEARAVELSESAIRKLPKNDSLLARLVGKLTK